MADDVGPERPCLAVRDLRKRFRGTVAVDGLSLDVWPGEVLGLIGPNGAGKSTTVKIISGQLLADEGSVLVGGHDVVAEPLAARRLTGYVPQDVDLYPFLTGRELLEFVAAARDVDGAAAPGIIDDLLERFRLTEAQHRLTREYSEGMARKLAVASALIGRPAVLILDEALTGLDPRAVAEVKAVVRSRLAKGVGVVLVSHLLEVVERLSHRVVLVDRGRVAGSLARSEIDERLARGETLEAYFLEHTAE